MPVASRGLPGFLWFLWVPVASPGLPGFPWVPMGSRLRVLRLRLLRLRLHLRLLRLRGVCCVC